MTYGVKGDDKMPPGRKPFGMSSNTAKPRFYDDGNLSNEMGRRSFTEGKNTGGAQAKPTVIRPGRYPNGDAIMGTPKEHVHGKVSTGYLDSAAHKYRADLRGHTSKKGHSNHG